MPCDTIEALAAAIRPPRPVIIMVQAGAAVDEQIAHLRGVLSANDIVIDAGNANFRHHAPLHELEGSSLTFIGMGVSAARKARATPVDHGRRHRSLLEARREGAYRDLANMRASPAAWLGTDGAGHFVKTIHNGIEYADMQMIAEIYGILRDGLGMAPKEIGQVFAEWNKGSSIPT